MVCYPHVLKAANIPGPCPVWRTLDPLPDGERYLLLLVRNHVLRGLSVVCYLDNILIAAPTESEHNLILEHVLQRLQESRIHLCEEKCMFGQQQVKCLGHCIDAMRIHPKVHAISEARSSREKRPSQRLNYIYN